MSLIYDSCRIMSMVYYDFYRSLSKIAPDDRNQPVVILINHVEWEQIQKFTSASVAFGGGCRRKRHLRIASGMRILW